MAMQSRRDLYQAHRLMTQRASLALLRGEPDVPDQPLRRMNVSTFAGILVAVIVAGIFGIWGLLFHGTPSLQKLQGSLIIDKQTGQNFVFCQNGKEKPTGQQICPVVNHASALLALATPGVPVQSVNQSSLTGLQQGPELGIPGLPDLPSAGLLIKQPWSACTQTLTGVPNAQGGRKTTTVVAGGFQPGGRPLGSTGLFLATTSSASSGFAGSSGSASPEWVIGNSESWPIAADTAGSVFSGVQPVSVPMDWLNALGQGSEFRAPVIADRGASVTGPAGPTQVGQLFKTVVGTNTHYYVIQHSGRLSSITQTQDSLLGLQPNVSTTPVNPSQVNGLVSGQLADDGLPATDTNTVNAPQSDPLCVVLTGPGPGLSTQVEVGGQMPSGGVQTGVSSGSTLVVNQVFLPGAKGALVQVTGSSISYLLVTNAHRYSMAGTSVPGILGYQLSQAVRLPAGFVDMIPPGPGLSPAEAQLPVSGFTGSSG